LSEITDPPLLSEKTRKNRNNDAKDKGLNFRKVDQQGLNSYYMSLKSILGAEKR
jgi:hypothetical protein